MCIRTITQSKGFITSLGLLCPWQCFHYHCIGTVILLLMIILMMMMRTMMVTLAWRVKCHLSSIHPRWPEPGAGFVPNPRILIQTQAHTSPTNLTFFSVLEWLDFVGPELQIQANIKKTNFLFTLTPQIIIEMVASCLTEELTWCSRRMYRSFWHPQLSYFCCPCSFQDNINMRSGIGE